MTPSIRLVLALGGAVCGLLIFTATITGLGQVIAWIRNPLSNAGRPSPLRPR